ncbi:MULTISPECIES: Fic family protein [unclassified Pseudomonas]|uniref:Fic family protein n=1 Tax=unclassified Pseudomonas TaxID=196821 RepID=UPI002ACB0E33|nr:MULTISPECIES: Fic family protein [unclassified Pseudomonas]MEB0089990.1 Fic family protein [Pseudomonas sp. CCI4.2]MEB0158398.1 Fic family protein [Pseudomonas sp. AH2 (2023)]WPX53543.1 Fic family protein [Pseudomonas sp. CCI4.2]WPX64345.1 Fic family protein [Pseudomonas sp. MH10]
MAFAFKHEGIHLELLARLFNEVSAEQLDRWIDAEPTGQYARRAGFFYEFLTGNRLSFKGVISGNYISALDENLYLTAPRPENNPRWRVRNNLPGTRDYCPMVLRNERIRQIEEYNCAQQLNALEIEFGSDLLQRSSVWLTIKESRASFAIEHEEQHTDRVQRFASVMEQRCGQYEQPLSDSALTDLQAQILGPRATRYGLRRSPVFVGEVDGFTDVVHYIAPHWNDAPSLLSGLRMVAQRTEGASALIRAAVLSFGFVYIHPMADGNGRISRFLINDVLRRDRAIPEPFILPVSATITSSLVNRRGYDQILELFSRPLMRRYAADWRFAAEQVAEDGVHYSLEFDAYQDALPAWRYPDLTDHVEYLGHVVKVTIELEMRKEADHLRALRLAREQVKNVLEGPDSDIDRIIRSVRENGGKLSNKLLKEFPLLSEGSVGVDVVAVIQTVFAARETTPELPGSFS